MASPSTAKQYAELVRRSYWDPIFYVRNVIGAQPDDWQCETMLGLIEKKKAAVAGCNGSGKDCLATWVGLWMLGTRPFAKGQITGPSQSQVFDTVWTEFKKWIDHGPILKHLIEWTKTRVSWKEAPERAFLTARTAAKRYTAGKGDVAAEGIQGMHGEHILIVITEASGVEPQNWDAAESCCTQEDNYILAVGNPLRRDVRLYDVFNKPEYKTWFKRHVSYLESSWVNRAQAEEWIERYGLDSPWVQVRCFGQFPKQGADDTAIPWELALAAMEREHALASYAPGWQLGVDVARYGGDEAVVAVRHDAEIVQIKPFKMISGPQLIGHIMRTVEEFELPKDVLIVVDEAGMGGAGVVDPLIQTHRFRNVKGVNNAWAADHEERYERWDDEQWMEHLCRFLEVGRVPYDEITLTQLTSRRYEFTSKGVEIQRRLESKDKFRARTKCSPDRAEAVMLACARGKQVVSVHGVPVGVGKKSYWRVGRTEHLGDDD